jgi:hypothetical protein
MFPAGGKHYKQRTALNDLKRKFIGLQQMFHDPVWNTVPTESVGDLGSLTVVQNL